MDLKRIMIVLAIITLFIGMPVSFAAGEHSWVKYNPDNTITVHSQCACGLTGDYLYHTSTFVNYCPSCHRYGSLHYVHNEGSAEGRLTCGDGYGYEGCDFDACAVDGKEEMPHTHLWLTRANAPQTQPTATVSVPQLTQWDIAKMQIEDNFTKNMVMNT